MLSPRNAIHPVAQVTAAHSELFYYDSPKTPNHHSDKTHTYCHSECHYPEARLARRKSSKNAPGEDIGHNCIQNAEAENYRCIHNNVSLPTVLTNDRDIDTMLFCDSIEQCLHTFITSLLVLR